MTFKSVYIRTTARIIVYAETLSDHILVIVSKALLLIKLRLITDFVRSNDRRNHPTKTLLSVMT